MSDIPDLHNICRCCHQEGSFKSLRLVYANKNCIEIYGIMIERTFNITINPPPFDASYTICDQCIIKLRDASCFKLQVLRCEEKLKEFYRSDDFESDGSKDEEDIQVNVDASKEKCTEEIINKAQPEPIAEPVSEESHPKECEIKITNGKSERKLKAQPEAIAEQVSDEPRPKESAIEISNGKSKRKRKVETIKRKGVLAKNLIPNLESIVKTDRGVCYRCNICDADFNTLAALRKHTPSKHKDAFKCRSCPEQFTNPVQYVTHVKTHSSSTTSGISKRNTKEKSSQLKHGRSKQGKHQCDLCKKFFTDKGAMRKHIMRHYGVQKECVCDICGGSFYNRTNMEIHMRAVHEKLRPYKCNVCSKTYTMKAHLKLHYRIHTGERPYECDSCSRKFDNLLKLKRHKLKSHRDGFTCKICDEKIALKGDFMSHMRRHAGQKEFKCHMCVKDFSSRFALNRHISHHRAVKSHECDGCAKKFKSKDELTKHKRCVHNPNKIVRKKVKCKICKKYFGNMKKHIDSHNKRPFSCDMCSKNYPERTSLNRHVKFAHDGVKFTCTVCDKQYVKKLNLKNHTWKEHKIKYKEPSMA